MFILPESFTFTVDLGTKVSAGMTVIASKVDSNPN